MVTYRSPRPLKSAQVQIFQKKIYDYYKHHKRDFAWRNAADPYHIVVSEIMLQQTQTDRVSKKYDQFLSAFPTIKTLAQTSVDRVIAAWQGLGYNRRALALRELAIQIVGKYDGLIPNDPETLVTFKGIGPNTAGSICAFAFNKPTIFIETNIRSVYIHHFFSKKDEVHDRDLMPLIAQTLDTKNPRTWYYALMDYGVMLKKTGKNPSRKSKHYTKQSRFEGSDRQVRGAILKLLVQDKVLKEDDFITLISRTPEKVKQILENLESEGFIKYVKGYYSLS